MVTLDFFFPHNVATWAHFFQNKPTPSFFFPRQVAKICPKKSILSWIGKQQFKPG
jgi:hypothetical protein